MWNLSKVIQKIYNVQFACLLWENQCKQKNVAIDFAKVVLKTYQKGMTIFMFKMKLNDFATFYFYWTNLILYSCISRENGNPFCPEDRSEMVVSCTILDFYARDVFYVSLFFRNIIVEAECPKCGWKFLCIELSQTSNLW